MPELKARCWAEINLDNLLLNYRAALKRLNKSTGLICVLKADAYGLGAVRVARALYMAGARRFAVACLSEALMLKDALPDADILVLGLAGARELDIALERGILLTVYSRACAEAVTASAYRLGKAARVHIKLDTGLNRLGFEPEDISAVVALGKDPLIRMEGLFTHLALRSADGDLAQFEAFKRFDARLKAEGLGGYMLHVCDSIGMLRYPQMQLDAVRAGAWLFGVPPYNCPDARDCLQVVSFKTRIAQVRDLKRGAFVGYDDSHPLARDLRAATLSCGYADGFPRMNNEGFVLIHGKKAPVLGLVCMDQMIVDVSNIPEAREGDEVTLLGDGFPVNDYARAYRLNHNEALCRIGRRVNRIYTLGGREEADK